MCNYSGRQVTMIGLRRCGVAVRLLLHMSTRLTKLVPSKNERAVTGPQPQTPPTFSPQQQNTSTTSINVSTPSFYHLTRARHAVAIQPPRPTATLIKSAQWL